MKNLVDGEPETCSSASGCRHLQSGSRMTTLYHHCQHCQHRLVRLEPQCHVFYKRALKRDILVFLFEPQQGILPSKKEKKRRKKLFRPITLQRSDILQYGARKRSTLHLVDLCNVDSAFMWSVRAFPCDSLTPLTPDPPTSSFICRWYCGGCFSKSAERVLLWIKLHWGHQLLGQSDTANIWS